MRRRGRNSREEGLADECGAFLTGTLTDRLEDDPRHPLEMTDESSLRNLQESVLIPLKLELATRSDVPFWTARRCMNTVTAELHRHNRTSQTS